MKKEVVFTFASVVTKGTNTPVGGYKQRKRSPYGVLFNKGSEDGRYQKKKGSPLRKRLNNLDRFFGGVGRNQRILVENRISKEKFPVDLVFLVK